VLHNGFCKDELQDMDTSLNILYPSWIHEQHWNDGIVLYNAFYNGGHEFSAYQWFHNDTALTGQTDAILFLPDNLVLNPDTLTETSTCPNEYYVQLTRKSDGRTSITCPICPVAVIDSIVPRLDYYSVVPTLVPHEKPVVGILSSVSGSYTITTSAGEQIATGYFTPDDKNYAGDITLPSVSGVYHVTLTSSQLTPRTCKVIVQ